MNKQPLTKHTTTILFKLLSGSIICCLLIMACSKTETPVQAEAPPPIQELIENFKAVNGAGCGCHPYIRQYIWRNQNVYMTGYNDALNITFVCDWIPVFYNSDGQRFEIDGSYSYEKYQDFLHTSRFIKTVWACE